MPIRQRYFSEHRLLVGVWAGTLSVEEVMAAPGEGVRLIGSDLGVTLLADLSCWDSRELPVELALELFEVHQQVDPEGRVTREVLICSRQVFESATEFRSLAQEARLPISLLTSVGSAALALDLPESLVAGKPGRRTHRVHLKLGGPCSRAPSCTPGPNGPSV